MKKFIKRYTLIILIVLVVILALTAGYFYRKIKILNNPQLAAQNEAKDLAEQIGEIVVLPIDETPTIATVTDPEALRDQAFFIDAQVGYKVLIYPNAKKAILYDPATHRIVNIAPLNIDIQQNGQSSLKSTREE